MVDRPQDDRSRSQISARLRLVSRPDRGGRTVVDLAVPWDCRQVGVEREGRAERPGGEPAGSQVDVIWHGVVYAEKLQCDGSWSINE
jgi:hypothetical protein